LETKRKWLAFFVAGQFLLGQGLRLWVGLQPGVKIAVFENSADAH